MVYLLRVFLIILIIILLFRSFTGYRIVQNDGDREPENDNSRKPDKKKISKDIGEYTDYEEVK
ncbi:MAG TPA: hypothetical protein PK719_03030 [Bacteroidales bacterium]|jgi:hypothetical protein|nr:hypothetical protein [Bacteroidales bacterium]OQB61332.1 MAG: hypothetical protein BWX96_01801 [Bacteroidetes bacterium ADurb.Bin145]HOU02059.1 hypothetical protein [Bacteroidales bacterium]HQG62608.1 hypothetical protein [Bacteroidales bacterium]HQK68079.1 hypothetical protein [Bacteroidales bacterium]